MFIIFFPLTLNSLQRLGIPTPVYFREQIWYMFNISHNDPSNIQSMTTPLTFPQRNMCTFILPGINKISLQPCARTGFYFPMVLTSTGFQSFC